MIPISGFQRRTSEWQLTVTATASAARARSSSASARRMLRSSDGPSRRTQPRPESIGEGLGDPRGVDAAERIVQLVHGHRPLGDAEPAELDRARLDVEVAGERVADPQHGGSAQPGGGRGGAHRADHELDVLRIVRRGGDGRERPPLAHEGVGEHHRGDLRRVDGRLRPASTRREAGRSSARSRRRAARRDRRAPARRSSAAPPSRARTRRRPAALSRRSAFAGSPSASDVSMPASTTSNSRAQQVGVAA